MNSSMMLIEGRQKGKHKKGKHKKWKHNSRNHRGGFGRAVGYGALAGVLGGYGYGYGYGYPYPYPYRPYGYGPYGGRGLFFGDKLQHEELKHHVENLRNALEDPSLSAERRIRLETLGKRIDVLFPAGVLIPLTEDLSEGDSDHENAKEYNAHAKQHNLYIKNGYDDRMSTAERKIKRKQAAERGLRLYKLRNGLKRNGKWNPY